jgi:hypothetical protein
MEDGLQRLARAGVGKYARTERRAQDAPLVVGDIVAKGRADGGIGGVPRFEELVGDLIGIYDHGTAFRKDLSRG